MYELSSLREKVSPVLIQKISPKNQYLILGILIRLLIAPFFGHITDMVVWEWAYFDTLNGIDIYSGWNNFVETTGYSYYAYPPAWYLTILISSIPVFLIQLLGLGYSPFVFRFFVKIPLIIADIVFVELIYRLVQKYRNEEEALKWFRRYLFSPVLIILSAVWGMFDILPAILILLTFVYMIEEKPFKSALCLGLAVNFKMFPIILLPFILPILKTWKERVEYTGVIVGINVLLILPFLIIAKEKCFTFLLFHGERGGQGLTWGSFSEVLQILCLFRIIPPEFVKNMTLIMPDLGKFLLVLTYGSLVLFHWFGEKRKDQFEVSLQYSILSTLLFFLFFPVVNEQYILWLLPLVCLFQLTTTKFDSSQDSWYRILAIWLLATLMNTTCIRFIPPEILPLIFGGSANNLVLEATTGRVNLTGILFFGFDLSHLIPLIELISMTVLVVGTFLLYLLAVLFSFETAKLCYIQISDIWLENDINSRFPLASDIPRAIKNISADLKTSWVSIWKVKQIERYRKKKASREALSRHQYLVSTTTCFKLLPL